MPTLATNLVYDDANLAKQVLRYGIALQYFLQNLEKEESTLNVNIYGSALILHGNSKFNTI